MKTIIIYYSFSGSTEREAKRLSSELGATLLRVNEVRNRSSFGSYILGCPQAMRRKAVAIRPLGIDLKQFDKIIIGCPIWAGFPAPAFNSIVQQLPAGKDVELFFCSGGGDRQRSEQGNKDLIKDKGCKLVSYRDVCTAAKPAKKKD